MDKVKIGFLGGCISNQKGMKRDNLYFSVVSKFLKQHQVKHQVLLGAYLSFNELGAQVEKYVTTKKPDIVYLFVRPDPLLLLHKPIIRYETKNKKIKYEPHPSIFSRKLVWTDKFINFQSPAESQPVRKNRFSLLDINLIAGITLGLHNWSMMYLTQQLHLAKQHCNARKIKLKIILPPQRIESILVGLICKWTTNYLTDNGKMAQLDYIDIGLIERSCYEHDRVHFNIRGHRKLGELILRDLISDTKFKHISNDFHTTHATS